MKTKILRYLLAIGLAVLSAALFIVVICLYGTTLALVPAIGCFWAFIGALSLLNK